MDDDEVNSPSFGVDDIIAIVEEDSTKEKPQILLGKILRLNHAKKVLLTHLKLVSKDRGVF